MKPSIGCGTAVRGVVILALLGAAAGAGAQITEHSQKMEELYGKPYVMVTINGRGPFRFIIDTGTGAEALVTPSLAEQLGLPTVAHATLNDPSGQGGKRVPILLMDFMELAGVRFENVHAVQSGFFAESGTCQGLLGFTLFRDFLLTLDFPNRKVTLANGALTPDGGRNVLPFRMPQGVPIASLILGGLGTVEAQLDSGGGGLVIPQSLASRLQYDVPPVEFASGQSVATCFKLKVATLDEDVKVGRYTFTHPVVEIHPAFPLVNFGSPPMQKFAITFDQKNLLVRFQAKGKKFSLEAPPSPPRMTNALTHQPPPGLVPVG